MIQRLTGGLGQLAKRRKVRVLRAHATLADSRTLDLQGDDPSIPADKRLTFEHAIVATGSKADLPAVFRLDSPRVWTSATALQLPEIPDSLLVVGGGYIGLELGTVYARLGSQVTVVEMADGLLPEVDRDLVRPLQRRLSKELDNRLLLKTRVVSLKDTETAIVATFEGPDRTAERRFSNVLVATGRCPASDGLGLETTGVQRDVRGFIVCGRQQRTAEPTILAIGDVAGGPMLAHKATHQAKIAVDAILGESPEAEMPAVPAVVFTDPEIAYVGMTQQQARETGRQVEVAAYPWLASGRAHAMGQPEGLTRWLVDPRTERLLGCVIVGAGAGELIGEAALALEKSCTIGDIRCTIHPHPTLSETLMNAADVYFGSAIEIYKPKRR